MRCRSSSRGRWPVRVPDRTIAGMTTPTRLIVRGLAAFALAAGVTPLRGQSAVTSPNGRNKVTITVNEGRLYYSLDRDRRPLILPSLLGFEFRGAAPLRDGLRVTDTARQSHDEWWTQPSVAAPATNGTVTTNGTVVAKAIV